MRCVSIIVPIYYGEKYIASMIEQIEVCRKCLGNQDFVELLLINDAPAVPLSRKWGSKFLDIKIVNTNENVGIHGARLKGLNICHGDYVLFLDQDDKIKAEYLDSQLKCIGQSDAVVCRAIHGKKPLYSERRIFENILSKELVLGGWNPIVSPGQVLLKKQSIPGIWTENVLEHNGADDWFLWLCMWAKGCSFELNQEVLYEHVLSGENTSKNILEMQQSEQEVMSIVQEKELFSHYDFKLLLGGFFKENLRRTQELIFFKEKIALLDKWMRLKDCNIRYSQYLARFGIRTVAIYGCGTLGEYLYEELKNEIAVQYFIDKNAKEIHKNIPVYPLDSKLPEVDGVIVTLIRESEKVEEELRETLCGNIFNLKDWLNTSAEEKRGCKKTPC